MKPIPEQTAVPATEHTLNPAAPTRADELSAHEVAAFLARNPDFFAQHAGIFAELRVPHPYETRAISLGERQVMTLRAKVAELEQRLMQQAQNATSNEKVSGKVSSLFAWMMSKTSPEEIPRWLVQSMATTFDYTAVALRLWDLSVPLSPEFTRDVTDDVKAYAAQLNKPYCGKPQAQPVLAWLPAAPESLAIVPLRKSPPSPEREGAPFGLLVLASNDASRFTPDMGTSFLEAVGSLSALSLGRLTAPDA